MDSETQSRGSTEELVRPMLSPWQEKRDGESPSPSDRWVAPEEHGKQANLSSALGIWRQTICAAVQSQLIETRIEGGLTVRQSEAALVTFSMF